MIKLIYPLRRLPHLSRTDFQTYWRETHAPLVRRHADVLGIRAYVQSHTLDAARNDLVRAIRGAGDVDYDGVAELWFDSAEALSAPANNPEAAAAAAELLDDEKRFIDVAASPIFVAEEHPVIAAPWHHPKDVT